MDMLELTVFYFLNCLFVNCINKSILLNLELCLFCDNLE
jgi:hypothetical protein